MSDTPELHALREMVPFYVNGTLSTEDKRAFEAALHDTPKLRDDVEREKALQQRFVDEMDSAFDNVARAGSDADEAKVQGLFGGTLGGPISPQPNSDAGGLTNALSFLNPANWNPAVTFALAAAAVGQTAYIASQSSTIADLEAENYQLASGRGDCDTEPAIIIELAGDAAWSDVNALLGAQQVSIVGTGSFGVLQLAHDNADDGDSDDADTAAVIEALSASPLVVSAEKAS